MTAEEVNVDDFLGDDFLVIFRVCRTSRTKSTFPQSLGDDCVDDFLLV